MRVEAIEYDILGVHGIARDLLSGKLALPGLIVPREVAQIPQPLDRFTLDERARLAETLEVRLTPLTPHVAVLDAVRSLRRAGACVVITGQQPGFLASPLYNIHKALHVLRLARTLTLAWERPVVAMFWNHADDHDLAEVNHAFVANENLDLQKIGLSSMASGRQPFSRVLLSESTHHLTSIRATLEELHRLQPHLRAALDVFCPRDGESLARAFTRSMGELFAPLGLVMLEPDWIRPELSRAMAEMLTRESAASGPTDFADALALGAQQVRAAGHEPQIDPATAALLYRVDARGRNALRVGGDGARYDGEQGSRNFAELAAEIVQDPEAWSPAALTRPIAQDACLPVAAYVGGLGELAYHAQLGPLRDFAGVPRSPFVPRFSCTLIEPEVEDSLAKLGLTAQAVLRARGQIAPEADQSQPEVIAILREIARRAGHEIVAQKEALAQLDSGLAANLKRTSDQMRALVERICEKAVHVHQNRSGKGQRHYRRLSHAFFPREQPQERVIGPLPFVARYGRDWIEELLSHVPALPREHTLVYLGDPPKDKS